ncbi:MAG: hypothetical protein HGB12_00140 [Bacteroidetes bacterium]|nr:hypothetical protein [Bacteroidota bacterium]
MKMKNWSLQLFISDEKLKELITKYPYLDITKMKEVIITFYHRSDFEEFVENELEF